MRNLWITMVLLASCTGLVDAPKTLAAPDVEYVVRWDPGDGGTLKTAADVISALGLEGEPKLTIFVAEYPCLSTPAPSDGTKVILRRRTEYSGKASQSDKVEWTYKLRNVDPTRKPACPLRCIESCKSGFEDDISFTGGEVPATTHSWSCSSEKDDAAADLQPPLASCHATMKRSKVGQIKIEEWILPKGVRRLEVSQKVEAKDSPVTPEQFYESCVKKLLAKNIKPLDESKTELASDCK